jgi:hypothetical protein
VYVVDFGGAGRQVHLKAVSGSGELQDYGQAPVDSGADSVSGVRYDPERRNLAWMGRGGGGEGFWLTTFDLQARSYMSIRPLFDTSAFTSDPEYYYWVGSLKESSAITMIMRLSKDEAAGVAQAYASN